MNVIDMSDVPVFTRAADAEPLAEPVVAGRSQWEAVDRYLQGLPIGREDTKSVLSWILCRSLLLKGGGDGPLAYMVNIRPARLIAKMLTIPFSDPDFTAPGLPVATLTGHSNWVCCVAVLADGRFVTGSVDYTVKVWKECSPGSGVWSVEATLTGHGNYVSCVAVLADGRFVTGSRDKTVKVWG